MSVPPQAPALCLLLFCTPLGAILAQAPGGEWEVSPPWSPGSKIEQIRSIALLRDLDGDGIDEILVGCPTSPGGGLERAGFVAVHSGADGRELWRIEGSTVDQRLGEAVHAAGDLDGDGVEDFAVTGFHPGVISFFSGATGAPLHDLAPPGLSFASVAAFGHSFRLAGDIDGDGVEDFLVGAPNSLVRGLNFAGMAFLISGSTHAVLQQWEGTVSWGSLGYSVAPAGDLDLDGVPDVVVGAGRDLGTGSGPGSAAAYSGADGRTIHSFPAPAGAFAFGHSVDGGQDADGDGVPDILIGSPDTGLPRGQNGEVFLYSGATGAVLYRFPGFADEELGQAVRFAGDLDGNGLADMVVGSPGIDTVKVYSDHAGILQTVQGRPGGRLGELLIAGGTLDGHPAPDWISLAETDPALGDAGSAVHGYSGLDAAHLVEVLGSNLRPKAGSALAAAADWNMDRVPDFAVGLPDASLPGRPLCGAIEILSGEDGSLIRRFPGPVARGRFGSAVALVEDLDGDGLQEVVGGAPEADPGGLIRCGSVFLIGSASGRVLRQWDGVGAYDGFGWAVAAIGDLDQDGISELAVGAPYAEWAGASQSGEVSILSSATGAVQFRLVGSAGDHLGHAVAGVGDVDGDQVPDFLAGAPRANGGEGYAEIFSGATARSIRRHEVEYPNLFDENFGYSVAGLGDLDGDGVPDLIVGANNAGSLTGGGGHVGMARVLSGSQGTLIAEHFGAANSQLLGWAVAGVGDLNGDGVNDYAIGSPGWKNSNAWNSGRVDLYSGADSSLLGWAESPADQALFGSVLAPAADRDRDRLADVLVGAPNQDEQTGAVYQLRLDPFLTPSRDSFRAGAGGQFFLEADFPGSEAGQYYRVFASFGGYGPTVVAGVEVPLTNDWVFQLSASPAAATYMPQHVGRLDSEGKVRVWVDFAPGVLNPYVGEYLHFAVLSGSDAVTGRLSSSARRIEILY